MITDAAGKQITSEAASILLDLVIVTQPEGGVVKAGEDMMAFVEVEGGKAPYTYQWETKDNGNWIKVPGATSPKLRISLDDAKPGDILTYRCIVTDAYGDSVISQEALLTVYADDLRITTQPRSVTAMPGNVPVFNIEVTGGRGPYTFDWYLGEEGGGTSVKNMYGVQTRDNNVYGYSEMQVLIYDSFKYTEENRYFFYCVVTDANGHKVTSKAFDINVLFEQFSANGTGSSRVRTGDNAVLNVNATGGQAPYTYTWMGYSNDAYSQGFTTNAVNWDGVQLSSDNSTLVVNTGDCDATAFTCEVRDATGTRVLVEFTFTVY